MVKSKLIIISLFLIIVSLNLIVALPDYFDWRNKSGENWMTGVKDQGLTCRSCWAFSAVGVTEAQYNIAKNDSTYDLNLSEEYLVSDCFQGNPYSNCRGGWNFQALGYIKDSGIVNETCFSYDDYNCVGSDAGCSTTTCTYNTSSACSDYTCLDNQCTDPNDFYYIDDYEYVLGTITGIKTWLYETGPVAVSMDWNDGGFDENNTFRCDPDNSYDHAVIITGYNETGDYWIVRNSYGPNWWINGGYFKVGFDECKIQDLAYGVNLTLCECTSWSAGECGGGDCNESKKLSNRTCTPSGCDPEGESKCVYDSSCESGGGSSAEITVCASGYNILLLTSEYKNDLLDGEEEDDIAYGWIPEDDQDNWYMTAGDPYLRIRYCRECPDEDNDNYHSTEENCGTNNDCDDYNQYINPGANIYCDCNNATGNGTTQGMDEICDNIDNDCDGSIDESLTQGCGLGICSNGTQSCSSGSWGSCSTNYLSTNEICNNLDDDCDGSIDEDLGSQECGTDIGECVKGTQTCSAGNWSECGGTYVGPINETCDGLDNNCNNIIDEDNVCGDYPNTTLVSPSNNYISYTGNITFNCLSLDDSNLENITLYHSIGGNMTANETKIIMGTSNSTTWTINNIPNETNFVWNCLVYDNGSHWSWSENGPYNVNVSLSYNPPNVTLVSPLDNSVDENGTVVFNFSVIADLEIENCSLWGNFGGSWELNQTFPIYKRAYDYSTEGTIISPENISDNNYGDTLTESILYPGTNLTLNFQMGNTKQNVTAITRLKANGGYFYCYNWSSEEYIYAYGVQGGSCGGQDPCIGIDYSNRIHSFYEDCITNEGNISFLIKTYSSCGCNTSISDVYISYNPLSNDTPISFNPITLSEGSYLWNVQCFNNIFQSDWADANWSVNVTFPPPTTTLTSPPNNSVDEDGTVTFNCSVITDDDLVNVTLYGNWSEGWHANETQSLCYQETANISTSCGGLDTGNYSCSDMWNETHSCSNVYDGNWDIYGKALDSNAAYLYPNYTIPDSVLNVTWQIKNGYDGILNLSIPEACLTQPTLRLRVLSFTIGTTKSIWSCYNETSIHLPHLHNCDGDAGCENVYEEAIWWDSLDNNSSFNKNIPNGIYIWNCYTCTNSLCSFSDSNWTINISEPEENITLDSLIIGQGSAQISSANYNVIYTISNQPMVNLSSQNYNIHLGWSYYQV